MDDESLIATDDSVALMPGDLEVDGGHIPVELSIGPSRPTLRLNVLIRSTSRRMLP